jgi:hypothetical protein
MLDPLTYYEYGEINDDEIWFDFHHDPFWFEDYIIYKLLDRKG